MEKISEKINKKKIDLKIMDLTLLNGNFDNFI